MRSITSIILFFFIQVIALTQPCLPEGITFTTQAQIDSFQINYPGCTEIEGNLIIGSNTASNITNLNGLDGITSIGGTVLIVLNPRLQTLDGLDSISYIGEGLSILNNDSLFSIGALSNLRYLGTDLELYTNPLLSDISCFAGLDTIYGSLEIVEDSSLTSLHGLHNIEYIGGWFWVMSNPQLENFTGISSLSRINNNFYIEANPNLLNFQGLFDLDSIAGDLFIGGYIDGGNTALESLSGLENLNHLGGDLIVMDNPSLLSLSGLDNVSPGSVDNITVIKNDSLSDCSLQWICDYLSNPNGTIDIYDNDAGCNNPPDIADECSITLLCLPYGNYHFHSQEEIIDFQFNYPGCTELSGDVYIRGSNIQNLLGLNVVIKIGGTLYIGEQWSFTNYQLNNLAGLDSLNEIGHKLIIRFNKSLHTLEGLENLVNIGGSLIIMANDSLTSLTGIDNIDASSITQLDIHENDSLSSCEAESVCAYLVNPYGGIYIVNNAIGCNSPEEVQDSCEANAVSVEEKFMLEDISVSPNPFTTSTTISYTMIDKPENVQFTVYNVQSQIVFMMQEKQLKGEQQMQWNAEGLPAGMYYFRMQAGTYIGSGKIIKMD